MVMQEKKYKLLIDDLSAIKYEEESEFESPYQQMHMKRLMR